MTVTGMSSHEPWRNAEFHYLVIWCRSSHMATNPAELLEYSVGQEGYGHGRAQHGRGRAAGDAERTVELLVDIRQHANAVGGSHAQRDVIDLTLIAAAARSGDDRLARALVAERTARKPSAAASAGYLAAARRPQP
jgi:hypothetical protein